MSKLTYDNPLRRQCCDITNLMPIQFGHSLRSMLGILPSIDLAKLNKIIITGCGDSYLAAVESIDAFKRYLKGSHISVVALRAIDAARFYPFKDDADDTAIIAVSASGNTARLVEVIRRGKKHGAMTIALTNAERSVVAEESDLVFLTNTPYSEDRSPGLRSYYASLLSLIVMSAVLGEKIKGEGVFTSKRSLGGQHYLLGEKQYVNDLKEKLLIYNTRFEEAMERIDDCVYETALRFKTSPGFECIADGPLFAAAEFVSAKFAEASGDLCSVIDSENYMHVNTFLRPKDTYGTIVMVFSDEKNVSQVVTSVQTAVGRDRRPLFVVSDKPANELGITAEVRSCVIPLPTVEERYIGTLYAYIPGSLLAGYHAMLIGEPFFRGGDKWMDPAINTLSTNEINVI